MRKTHRKTEFLSSIWLSWVPEFISTVSETLDHVVGQSRDQQLTTAELDSPYPFLLEPRLFRCCNCSLFFQQKPEKNPPPRYAHTATRGRCLPFTREGFHRSVCITISLGSLWKERGKALPVCTTLCVERSWSPVTAV